MIPQNHEWQIQLWNWVKSKSLADFEVELTGLTFNESWFEQDGAYNDDAVHRLWLTCENLGRYIVKNNGLRIVPEHFLSSSIEKDGSVFMKLDELVEPAALAWIYSWNYEGNPHYQQEEVANRALVACAVDMIMAYDHFIEGNLQSISQSVASAFATWAYVYDTLGENLDTDTKLAYEFGLSEFFSTIEQQGPTGTQADLDLPGILGMFYTAQRVPGLTGIAEEYARSFMADYFNEAGYIDHGGGFDPSYNGISIHYLVWAAHVTGYDFLIEALDKIHDLKSHLTFPEPTDDPVNIGKVLSPSSFATSNTFGSCDDQYWSYGRDVAASMLTDNAAYLRYDYRNIDEWRQPFGLKPVETMLEDLRRWIVDRPITTSDPYSKTWITPLEIEMPKWQVSRHLEIPQMEWDAYPDGFYNNCCLVPDSIHHGFGACINFIKRFGDEFVIFRKGEYSNFGGAIHTGGLSWWDDSTKLPGLGGGVCALWARETGTVMLGKNRGYPGSNPDTWQSIEQWAVNHIWGYKDEVPHSSARNRGQIVTTIIDGDSAMVKAEGYMYTPDGDSGVLYRATYSIGKELTCSWQFEGELDDAYVSLPIYANDTTLSYKVGGKWQFDPGGMVEAIAIHRNGSAVLVELENARQITLGALWVSTYQGNDTILPVHIDVNNGGLRYTVSGPHKLSIA